ncbi:structure-specific endonuclease subunit SLX4 [Topomyia yanbarensis]|uniref:structure-specific endonuclease subunit SLX4 n=1 Tax=Topomyia yanbarensis TaxID=2498891 RepID=UPI00273BC282|nr:structure-specific endonuclease subunit SLX4 [Topomyia yanbarensis]
MASTRKVKYAKLRLFKSTTAVHGSQNEEPQDNGEISKSPPKKSIQQMEQEIICLSNDEGPVEHEEPILKRTRVDPIPHCSKPAKLPNVPPDRGGGIISKFFKTTEDDFEPDKRAPVVKAKTKVQRKTVTRKARATRKSNNQSDIRKVFQKYQDNDEQLLNNLMLEHTVADRLDPEQFQLALAMSRSLVDQGGSQQSETSVGDNVKASSSSSSISSEERRIQGIRATLEQYGFRCKNSYQDYDLNAIFGNNVTGTKPTKKSKGKKPCLLVRRDRKNLEAFMELQSEQLLHDDFNQPLVSIGESNWNHRTYGSNIFWMSENAEQCAKIMSDYYVEGVMDMSPVSAGYLLKNWHKIPGREWTPERCTKPPASEHEFEIDIQPVEFDGYELIEDPEDSLLDMNTVPDEYRQKYNNEVPIHVRSNRSASPDLFDSDSGEEAEVNRQEEMMEVVEVWETPSDEDMCGQANTEAAPGSGTDEQENCISVMCTSSENIFDDCEPIVDYEMYSSEEAKISTVGPAEKSYKRASSPRSIPSQIGAIMDHDQDHVVLLSSEENSNQEMAPIPVCLPQQLSPTETVFPSPGKNLSFHALAVKDKLSRVSFNEMETIALEEDLDDAKATVRDESSTDPIEQNIDDRLSDHSKTSLHAAEDDHDDVLVISDDEVNYSIRQDNDNSAIYNVSPLAPDLPVDDVELNSNELEQPVTDTGVDLDSTTVYFNAEEFENRKTKEICLISSDEETDTVSSRTAVKADNTMAFLDGLVEKYNLSPSQPANCDTTNQSVLANYLDNYEIPDFSENHESDCEDKSLDSAPVSQKSEEFDREIEQILCQAKQTCTQLEQSKPRSNPIKRTTSDSALLNPRKRKYSNETPAAEKRNAFREKFKPLTEEPKPAPAEYQIVLDSVSPRPDYDGMVSPLLHRELFKYGLKQLSRPKAVKILNHIYEQLHPMVEINELDGDDDELESVEMHDSSQAVTVEAEPVAVKSTIATEPSFLYNMDRFCPEFDDEEYILPAKPRKKTFWCAVPLNIAFYNMVKTNPSLLRQILRYQPIDLDAVYSHLKEIGLRYETNDLIAFLDKRCITFRTAQGSGSRTKKRSS